MLVLPEQLLGSEPAAELIEVDIVAVRMLESSASGRILSLRHCTSNTHLDWQRSRLVLN